MLIALIFLWNGLQGAFVSTVVIETGMPVGLVAPMLVRTYGGDASFTATATFYTTLAAIISTPLIAWLVTRWF
jgi:predicted permease